MTHIIGTAGDDRGVDALHGTADDDLIEGFQGRDELFGGDGSDELDGGEDADKMYGGKGNDIYHVDNAGDLVVELAGEGSDTVFAARAYTLTNNVEKLVLTGSGNYQGNGNALNNSLIGNDGNNRLNGGDGNDTIGGGLGDDTLDGGSGLDTLNGGDGNDRYFLDKAADVVVEYSHHGSDTVFINGTYTLGANVENLTMTGDGNRFGTGNALDNVMTGNAGNNTLGGSDGNDIIDGGLGADTMRGGMGDDTFYVDNPGDAVVEYSGQGTDTVITGSSYELFPNVENLTLTGTADIYGIGNSLDNLLIGNAGANSLDGKRGADTMIGGAGNDTYTVDNAGDTVSEDAGGGVDTVIAAFSYTLGANVENLLLGSHALNGTGNSLDNTLSGSALDNDLDGAAGADSMSGKLGNDTYHVDNAGDQVHESTNAGIDTVMSSVSYTLSDNVENLVLSGGNLNGTGNGLDNSLTGTAGNNTLNGGAGADLLAGGAGNDTYIVDNLADVILENPGEGTDTVRSSQSYGLSDNLENLFLTGTANIDGTGNAGNNLIMGNAGDNSLDGGDGTDTLDFTGHQAVIVDLVAGTATGADIGSDHLVSIDKVIGTTFDDSLTGAGVQTLTGGAGNDTYYVGSTSIHLVEAAGGGTDTVVSSVNFALDFNFENLTLSGTDSLTGRGNRYDNVIIANDAGDILNGYGGNDTLIGGAGNDSLFDGGGTAMMRGGLGNDTYRVDGIGSVVDEDADGGIDTIVTTRSYSLVGLNVENLSVSVNDDAQKYYLTGNELNNTLHGGNEHDVLSGGAGDDILTGGGNGPGFENVGDTFVFSPGFGHDTVTDFQPNDERDVYHVDGLDFSAFDGTGRTVHTYEDGNNLVYDWGDGDVLTLLNMSFAAFDISG